MTTNHYTGFLPARWRRVAESVEPDSTWWAWPDAQTSHGRAAGEITVHVARAARPNAHVRVMLVHGAGGHSGLVWPLAAILANEGCDVLAPDLPLYGRTRVEHPSRVRYHDWPAMLRDLVTAETASDSRPLVLFGASMGGMLCYEAAHTTQRAAAVVVTCLLDFAGDRDVIRHATRHQAIARGAPLLQRMPKILGRLRIPVAWFAPVHLMSKNAALARRCATDPYGAASRLPLQLLADMLSHTSPPPETFHGPEVTLLHPGSDDWTPAELSMKFANRIAPEATTHLLTNCGHFPLEEPGIDELAYHLRALRDRLSRNS